MKSTLLIATLLMISLFVTGCGNSNDINNNTKILGTAQVDTGLTEELVEQPAIDLDIGTLDDIPVSEELPQ